MYSVVSDLTNDDKVEMDVQKGSVAKDTYGLFSGANVPISVAAPKSLSSNIDSKSVLMTKTTSFA